MIDARAGDFVQLKDIAGAWIDGDCAGNKHCFLLFYFIGGYYGTLQQI